MSRSDKLSKLFWAATPDRQAGRRGPYYVTSSKSHYGTCPRCQQAVHFLDGIGFCDSCGTKLVKGGDPNGL